MISYSLELFPPRSPQTNLVDTLARVCRAPVQNPDFVSLTCRYGCEEATFYYANQLHSAGYRVAVHLLHYGSSKQQINHLVDRYYQLGIRHVVALRGDVSNGREADKDGFASTAEFVEALRYWHPDLEISVAGYPDVHPEADSWQHDLDFLQQKTDAGADRILTQLFFSPTTFLRFLQRSRQQGIGASIVPGLMPITDFAKIKRFAQRCQVVVPGNVHRLFALNDDKQQSLLLAMAFLTSQVQHLYNLGVIHFHFYMLNMPLLIRPLLHWLGCCQNNGFSPTSRLSPDYFNSCGS